MLRYPPVNSKINYSIRRVQSEVSNNMTSFMFSSSLPPSSSWSSSSSLPLQPQQSVSLSSSMYLFQVVPMLVECQRQVDNTIDCLMERSRRKCRELVNLQITLQETDELIRQLLLDIVQIEKEEEVCRRDYHIVNQDEDEDDTLSILSSLSPGSSSTSEIVTVLQNVHELKKRNNKKRQEDHCNHHHHHEYQYHHNPQDAFHHHDAHKDQQQQRQQQRGRGSFDYVRRSRGDTLMFRLTVILQIASVRVMDIYDRTVKERNHRSSTILSELLSENSCRRMIMLGVGLSAVSLYSTMAIRRKTYPVKLSSSSPFSLIKLWKEQDPTMIVTNVVATVSSIFVLGSVRRWLVDTFYLHKVNGSASEIQSWNVTFQQLMTNTTRRSERMNQQNEYPASRRLRVSTPLQHNNNHSPSSTIGHHNLLDALEEQPRRLMYEHALNETRTNRTFWMSQGDLRWMMLKRFMDVYYASVGAAISTKRTSPMAILLMTGAASCFYSITGVSKRTMNVVNESSYDLIKNAWGMVSLPALKQASQLFTRYLKGASVAERVDICGVPCFILSKNPVPELALRVTRRKSSIQVSKMSTISEAHSDLTEETSEFGPKNFGKRNVILHLTGGGFFAHTLASDLPFLLDWSAKTNAVVVAPEYALLPEKFPVALKQIVAIYEALIHSPSSTVGLPFEVDRVCVTGESAGGNLAAALCCHLAASSPSLSTAEESSSTTVKSTDANVPQDREMATNRPSKTDTNPSGSETRPVKMPDCLMLSCPALDLSLSQLTESHIRGQDDPVLPSGLLAAISEAYLSGFDKKDPLCSPLYIDDHTLQHFPPTLLFSNSDDPLLDDAVVFNERLQTVGVDSEIRTATNVGHAYLGLASAGFPEAIEQHEYAMKWLNNIFN